MNTHYVFEFNGATFWALAEGALWWPSQKLLCVSDLHLGKSDRIARRSGRMLPPYETEATLDRLGNLLSRLAPSTIICLGDSFDDLDAALGLSEEHKARITTLQAGRTWIWVEGNHDPGPIDIGGDHKAEVMVEGLTFRHIAAPYANAEVSGHYHPKCRLQTGSSRPAFLINDSRIVLPAFGTYTGGLRASDSALKTLMGPNATAILTGKKALPVPMAATT